MDPIGQIRLVRADAAPFAGDSIADARREAGDGWIGVGVSRDGTVYTDEAVTIEVGDEVFVTGSDDALQEFERTVDTS